jgi:Endoribonuclease L-PSP
MERQTELVLEQMKLCLETAGSSLEKVLKCNVYCTSVEKCAAVKQPAESTETPNAAICSEYLGLNPRASGLMAWDVFDAVLRPGDLILLMSWHARTGAEAFENSVKLPSGARLRRVRIVRDYGMFDRREAPEYYPDVERAQRGV